MARKSKICTLCMSETPELAKNYCERCPHAEMLKQMAGALREYRKNNREKVSAQSKRYAKNIKKWRENNRDKKSEYDHFRYLRKKSEKAGEQK